MTFPVQPLLVAIQPLERKRRCRIDVGRDGTEERQTGTVARRTLHFGQIRFIPKTPARRTMPVGGRGGVSEDVAEVHEISLSEDVLVTVRVGVVMPALGLLEAMVCRTN